MGSCRNCVRCLRQDLDLSKQDREVLAKVRDSLKVIETEAGPQVLMSYPLNANYDLLVNNRMQVIARETSVEKQLIKLGRLEEYNAAYQDSIDRGAMAEISQKDIEAWLSDPTHRIHYTGNDSKMKNGWTGP